MSLQQRWGEKLPPTKTRKRNKLGINSQAGGGEVVENAEKWFKQAM